MIQSAIIFAIVLSGVLGVLLMYRQAAAVASHRERVPDGFAGSISAEEHRRAAAYQWPARGWRSRRPSSTPSSR